MTLGLATLPSAGFVARASDMSSRYLFYGFYREVDREPEILARLQCRRWEDKQEVVILVLNLPRSCEVLYTGSREERKGRSRMAERVGKRMKG